MQTASTTGKYPENTSPRLPRVGFANLYFFLLLHLLTSFIRLDYWYGAASLSVQACETLPSSLMRPLPVNLLILPCTFGILLDLVVST